MWKTLLLFLCIGVCSYQGILLYEAHEFCLRTHLENEYLLKNPLCADPWQRRLHGPKQDQVCHHAAFENTVHPLACAWKKTWDQVGINRLWLTITESYWLLFGIITPTCCMSVIMLFWSCNQSSARKATQQMQRELIMTLEQMERPRQKKRQKVYQLIEPIYQQQREERNRIELLNV